MSSPTIMALAPCFREPIESRDFIFNYAFRIWDLHPVECNEKTNGLPDTTVKWTWERICTKSNSNLWTTVVSGSVKIDISSSLTVTERYLVSVFPFTIVCRPYEIAASLSGKIQKEG